MAKCGSTPGFRLFRSVWSHLFPFCSLISVSLLTCLWSFKTKKKILNLSLVGFFFLYPFSCLFAAITTYFHPPQSFLHWSIYLTISICRQHFIEIFSWFISNQRKLLCLYFNTEITRWYHRISWRDVWPQRGSNSCSFFLHGTLTIYFLSVMLTSTFRYSCPPRTLVHLLHYGVVTTLFRSVPTVICLHIMESKSSSP